VFEEIRIVDPLRWTVLAAGAASLTALAFRARWATAFGGPKVSAPARGSAGRGIAYALGRGLLPWEKESARRHLATYIGGIIYHTGVFCAFVVLGAIVAGISLPRPLIFLLRVGLAAGFASGLGLLVKRAALPLARALSRFGDYAANFLVDIFVALALAAALDPRPTIPFMALSVILFLYVPLGKIRHCLFFFRSRIKFGRLLGRRVVLPPGSASAS
jgi:hypothetical protein